MCFLCLYFSSFVFSNYCDSRTQQDCSGKDNHAVTFLCWHMLNLRAYLIDALAEQLPSYLCKQAVITCSDFSFKTYDIHWQLLFSPSFGELLSFEPLKSAVMFCLSVTHSNNRSQLSYYPLCVIYQLSFVPLLVLHLGLSHSVSKKGKMSLLCASIVIFRPLFTDTCSHTPAVTCRKPHYARSDLAVFHMK